MISHQVNVRGQMGVQLLEAAVGLSRIPINSDKIEIQANYMGLGEEAKMQIPKLCLPVGESIKFTSNSGNDAKTPYWEPGAAKSLFENRPRVLHRMALARWERGFRSSIGTVHIGIHVRGRDKKMASEENYKTAYDLAVRDIILSWNTKNMNFAPFICTDDNGYCANIANYLSTGLPKALSPVQDWRMLFDAECVITSPSAFVLSMLIYDPHKRIYVLGPSLCDGPFANHNDFVFIQEAMNHCPNLKILEE